MADSTAPAPTSSPDPTNTPDPASSLPDMGWTPPAEAWDTPAAPAPSPAPTTPAPAVPAQPASSTGASDPLSLIERDESSDRNVPNYRYDSTHTAQGYPQITNTNWRAYAPRAGIDLNKFPSAMAAPKELQDRVAGLMYNEQGFKPWAPYNPKLRQDIAAAGGPAAFSSHIGGAQPSNGAVPVPTPPPTPQPGPKTLGPFTNLSDAYASQPNTGDYVLNEKGGAYSWVPHGELPAGTNPETALPISSGTAQAVTNSYAFDNPSTWTGKVQHVLYNFGSGAARELSNLPGQVGTLAEGAAHGLEHGALDIPWVNEQGKPGYLLHGSALVDRGVKAITAGMPPKPLNINLGHVIRIGENKIGIPTQEWGNDLWSNLGWWGGQGAAAAIPFALGGELAAPEAGSLASRAAAGEKLGPISRFIGGFGERSIKSAFGSEGFGGGHIVQGTAKLIGSKAAEETALGAGTAVTQGEAHNLYQEQTGRSGDFGDLATQLIAGGMLNLGRVALIEGAIRGTGKGFRAVWGAGKRAFGKPENVPMTEDEGQQLADDYLRTRFQGVLQRAHDTLDALGTAPAGTSASWIKQKTETAVRAAHAWAAGGFGEEGSLWGPAGGINMLVPVDLRPVHDTVLGMKANHFGADRARDPESWPSDAEDLIMPPRPQWTLGKGPKIGGKKAQIDEDRPFLVDQYGNAIENPLRNPPISPGLNPVDSLGRVQDTRSRLLAMSRAEKAKGLAANGGRIKNLDGMADALTDALTSDNLAAGGATPEEVEAYSKAKAFTKQFRTLRQHPLIQSLLNVDPRNPLMPGSLEATDKFLYQDAAGADAARLLTRTAVSKYGSEGMLGAIKDIVRQNYADAVAPGGFVNLAAHERFMARNSGLLQDPAFADVKQQLDTAAASERGVQATPGVGKKFGTFTTASADRREAASDLYLDAPTTAAVNHLERSANPAQATRTALDQLGNDPTGNATTGFKHVIARKALADPQWATRNPKIVSEIDKIDPGFGAGIAHFSAPTTFGGLRRQLVDFASTYLGAHFIGDKLGRGMGSSMVMASRSGELARTVGRMPFEKALNLSTALIADPQTRTAWLNASRGWQSPAQAAADMVLLHAYVPGEALLNTPTGAPDTGAGQLGGSPNAGGGKEQGVLPNGQPWWTAPQYQHPASSGAISVGEVPGTFPNVGAPATIGGRRIGQKK